MFEEIENAINDNDDEYLKELFEHYEHNKVSDDSAASLICLAIERGYWDILEQLLRHFDGNFSDFVHMETDDYGSLDVPLLIIAIKRGDLACVKALIETGRMSVNITSYDCFSPLGYAFIHGEEEIASYLLKKKAQLNHNDIIFINKSDAALTIEQILDIFKDTKHIKKIFADALTLESKHTQQGIRPAGSKEIIQEYHSFKHCRERQLLRHVSTQLYFSLKPDNEDLTELQSMHLICDGKSNLFIVANKYDITKKFKDIDSKDFKSKLLTVYLPRTMEEKIRSSRYANKLKTRIFGEQKIAGSNEDDLKKANYLRKILRKKHIEYLTLDYNGSPTDLSNSSVQSIQKKLAKSDDTIFFLIIENCSYKSRHAEEFLCDIAKIATKKFDANRIESSIAGKKRPCFGCTGRMTHEGITNYGHRPGYFFKNTIEHQSAKIAAKTFEAFNGNFYLSGVSPQSKQLPVSDFDSGSDSDEVDNHCVI